MRTVTRSQIHKQNEILNKKNYIFAKKYRQTVEIKSKIKTIIS